MRNGDSVPAAPRRSHRGDSSPDPSVPVGSGRKPLHPQADTPVIMTEVSPFHCLYSDALDFHSQSRQMMTKSVSSASRLARASILLYIEAVESLIHQAAVELGRPDLAPLVGDASRPLPLADAWKLLPAIVANGSVASDPESPPWPQFAELLTLRASWSYPGPAQNRRAYYRAAYPGADFEPLQPHQIPTGLHVTAETLLYPRTGLPRDPYALRPHHLDTARSVIDAAINAIDRRIDGALTRENRHRREPVRQIHPAPATPPTSRT